MNHIAQAARGGRLRKGPCKSCDKNAIKRNLVACRGSAELNGPDAVAEFTRHLSERAKRIVLAKPKPKVPVAGGHSYRLHSVTIDGVDRTAEVAAAVGVAVAS